MIVVDNNKGIDGSSVKKNVVIEPHRHEVGYKEKVKKQSSQKNKKHLAKKRVRLLRNIGVGLLIGLLITGRYSMIYSNQNKINSMKNEINNVKYSNDDLRVSLLKFNDINAIDKEAREKFAMKTPGVNNIVYSDLSKNNFGESKVQDKNENKFLGWLKSILF